MIKSTCLLLISTLALFPTLVGAAEGNSVLSAFHALPVQFQDGVVRVSADDARPDPTIWYFTSRKNDRRGLLTNLNVSHGQILSERPSINPRSLLTGASAISWRRIQCDSTDAWRLAQEFANRRSRTLASVSFVLEQRGRDAAPIWSVWCYDPSGRYIGFMSILATNGSILSTD